MDVSTIPVDIDDFGKKRIYALFAAGVGIEQIARSENLDEAVVKAVIAGKPEDNVVNGEVTFEPAEIALLKANAIRLAMNGENDSIKLKATLWILGQCSVSNESKFKAKHGLNQKANVQNILVSVQQSRENLRSKYGDE